MPDPHRQIAEPDSGFSPAFVPFAAFDREVAPAPDALRAAITAAYRRDEGDAVQWLLGQIQRDAALAGGTQALAQKLVQAVRAKRSRASGVDALMHEFSLSSEEGVALMCLAEALLRIPDHQTADRLIADKISRGDWRRHLGESPSLFVNAATWGLLDHRQAGRHQQRAGTGLRLEQADRQGRRAADPQGRRPGDAHAGQPVRHRPDHRRGAGQQPRQRGARLPLFLRHAGRGGADRARRGALLRRLRTRDPRHRPRRQRPRHQGRPRHFGQAVGAAPALQPRPARARDGRTAAAPEARCCCWPSSTTSASTSTPRKPTAWNCRWT